jgi:cytoskeletal protein RodZ
MLVGGAGARLRRERELRGISIEEISRATRIPVSSLQRLEDEQYDTLPGEIFVRGFLRSYAKTLGIDDQEVLVLYTSARRSFPSVPLIISGPRAAPRNSTRWIYLALALVIILVLGTMALSFVLRPRGRDIPSEVSQVFDFTTSDTTA